MTVAALHKALSQAIARGQGRLRVAINEPSFTHPLENDGCVFLDVHKTDVEEVYMIDEDGGLAVDSKGRQRYVTFFVLDGGNDPRLLEE